jgi:large subunit ribosomal protein L21
MLFVPLDRGLISEQSTPKFKSAGYVSEVNMYAIVENGSKQYKAEVGSVIKFEKLTGEVGAKVELNVLMVSDENGIKVAEEAKAYKAVGEIVEQGKGKKITVFKYKAKKNERKKQGHRQPFTAVRINEIAAK